MRLAARRSVTADRDSRGDVVEPRGVILGLAAAATVSDGNRSFVFGERWRATLIGEVFNLFNFANLSGYSGNLLGAGFGQPTSRITQVFGSGGPRAFQLGGRFEF